MTVLVRDESTGEWVAEQPSAPTQPDGTEEAPSAIRVVAEKAVESNETMMRRVVS